MRLCGMGASPGSSFGQGITRGEEPTLGPPTTADSTNSAYGPSRLAFPGDRRMRVGGAAGSDSVNLWAFGAPDSSVASRTSAQKRWGLAWANVGKVNFALCMPAGGVTRRPDGTRGSGTGLCRLDFYPGVG